MIKKKKKRTFDKNAKIAKRREENCSLIGEGNGNNVETFLMGRKSIVISEKAPIRHHKCPYIYIYKSAIRKSKVVPPAYVSSLDKERPCHKPRGCRTFRGKRSRKGNIVCPQIDDHTRKKSYPSPIALFFTSLSLSLYVCSRDTFLSKSGTNEVNQYSLRTVKKKGNQISLRDEED